MGQYLKIQKLLSSANYQIRCSEMKMRSLFFVLSRPFQHSQVKLRNFDIIYFNVMCTYVENFI